MMHRHVPTAGQRRTGTEEWEKKIDMIHSFQWSSSERKEDLTFCQGFIVKSAEWRKNLLKLSYWTFTSIIYLILFLYKGIVCLAGRNNKISVCVLYTIQYTLYLFLNFQQFTSISNPSVDLKVHNWRWDNLITFNEKYILAFYRNMLNTQFYF